MKFKPLALLKKSITTVPQIVRKGGDPLVLSAKKAGQLIQKAAAGWKQHRQAYFAVLLVSVLVMAAYLIGSNNIVPERGQKQEITLEEVPAAQLPAVTPSVQDIAGSPTVPEAVIPAAAEKTVNMENALMPAAGQISGAFGFNYSPTYGDYRMHQGIDITASEGDSVVAMESGTVEQAEADSIVVVNHGGGWISSYRGIGRVKVIEGQQVNKGDELAVIGPPPSEEKEAGPHLHLQAAKDGEYLDPSSLWTVR